MQLLSPKIWEKVVITHFWVTPNLFSFSSKKKKKKKLHGAVLNGTVQLFSPANAETREKKIFEIFFPLTLSFSTSPLA
jgi:hypothetical protein